MSHSLIEIIAYKYPTKSVALIGADWADYSSIEWSDGVAISAEQLALDAIVYAKYKATERVRREAATLRDKATASYLGTSDQEQLRTYEEKYIEALSVIANAGTPTPILDGETMCTGEEHAALAALVKSQYEYLKNLIRIAYGNIEGRRRVMLAQINALTTADAADNFVTDWTAPV